MLQWRMKGEEGSARYLAEHRVELRPAGQEYDQRVHTEHDTEWKNRKREKCRKDHDFPGRCPAAQQAPRSTKRHNP